MHRFFLSSHFSSPCSSNTGTGLPNSRCHRICYERDLLKILFIMPSWRYVALVNTQRWSLLLNTWALRHESNLKSRSPKQVMCGLIPLYYKKVIKYAELYNITIFHTLCFNRNNQCLFAYHNCTVYLSTQSFEGTLAMHQLQPRYLHSGPGTLQSSCGILSYF